MSGAGERMDQFEERAREITDSLCGRPDVWLTHGMPGEYKMAEIEKAIAAALRSAREEERARYGKLAVSNVIFRQAIEAIKKEPENARQIADDAIAEVESLRPVESGSERAGRDRPE